MEPLTPAVVAYDEHGTPFSPQYGDIYHSAAGGASQARHVFLNGNGLPERWRGRDSFTILETGFGLGTNFLATWQAWRDDARRPQRLHYVSVEKHPTPRAFLAAHATHAEWSGFSPALLAEWPHALPGLHRLEFESGGVILTLAFGDVGDILPALDLGADALYLDGFGPEHNPDMWTPRVAKALARLARDGCTLATYTCARSVRDALESAGFQVAKAPGHGAKRDMLTGRYAPRASSTPRRHAPRAARHAGERHALVIGAGLAGAAVCERLRSRGWTVEVISGPPGTSGNLPAAVFHGHLSADDCLLSRWVRAGTLYGQRRWQALEKNGAALSWRRCGALQVSDAPTEQHATWIRRLGLPAEYAQAVTRTEAARRLGHDPGRGGLWLADAGWMQPATLTQAQLDGVSRHTARSVASLACENGRWAARDGTGCVIASAPVAILANAGDAARLCDSGVPLSAIGGRITLVRGGARLQAVICGDGYVAPMDGQLAVGASYETDGPLAADAADAGNLARLSRLVPGLDATVTGGAQGVRSVARDRMPVIGGLPDRTAIAAQRERLRGAPLQALPRLPGLYGAYAYGSRGLAWAALGAELIACDLEGEPAPVERALRDAADPARFLLKALRHAA